MLVFIPVQSRYYLIGHIYESGNNSPKDAGNLSALHHFDPGAPN